MLPAAAPPSVVSSTVVPPTVAPVEAEVFRHALRQKAAAVTIVTTRVRDAIHGMTATSVAGICLDPPLMLVCVANRARTHELIAHAHIFAINFLKQGQRGVAESFAGQARSGDDRFQGLHVHSAVTGAPILTDCLAYFDCVVVDTHPAVDHTIYIGQVCATGTLGHGLPLIYHDRNYLAIS